jgi:hypothetical protein
MLDDEDRIKVTRAHRSCQIGGGTHVLAFR